MSIMKNMRMLPSMLNAMTMTTLRQLDHAICSEPSECPPIIFMHGFCGFNEIEILGVKVMEYWNGIPELLNQMGYITYTPEVSPFNPPQIRAQEWKDEIEKIKQAQPFESCILIGHSQGSIDARLLTCPRTDIEQTTLGPLNGKGFGGFVDKVITIGGPHLGNVQVDLMAKDKKTEKIMNDIFSFAGLIAQGITREKQNPEQAIAAMGQQYMIEEFNPYCIEDQSVEYYCIAGTPQSSQRISPILKDAWEALNALSYREGGGINDGFVTAASALYGNHYAGADPDYRPPAPLKKGNPNWTVIGTVLADHVTEVGLPLDFPKNKFYDHLSCFAGLAQFADPNYIGVKELKDNGRWVTAWVAPQKSTTKSGSKTTKKAEAA